ncbi:MAG: response regulator receiver protein [Verrucomicrobiales bacterium]|nr:response regulator receiver protein [Verrucomicrobiales bacterium]
METPTAGVYLKVSTKLSIYYLENDENDELLLQRAFQKLGVHECVKWFQFSADLCAKLAELKPEQWPDIFLLDLKLNGESGIDVLDCLKKLPDYPRTPIFLFSSGLVPREVEAGLKLGATAYLQKPGNFGDFHEVAAQLLEFVRSGAIQESDRVITLNNYQWIEASRNAAAPGSPNP